MKTRKFTAMLLTLAMAFSLLTVSAGAVMDNDHDRIRYCRPFVGGMG